MSFRFGGDDTFLLPMSNKEC